ncbi:MAG TPA: single-stranded DNA-binding protein [Arenimonas sp.]|nr:single-stranded DNA-binding protein [Arenimonas sp.]
MARGINKVILVGTVGKDPEVRYFQSGDAYTTLSVATSESWKDKQGEKQEKTEWHRVKFTRRLAEIVGEYVKKGQQIYVEGKLETSKYTDKQGVERYSTDIVANEMQMLGSKSSGGGERSGGYERDSGSSDTFSTPKPANRAPAPAKADAFVDNDPFGDDVPF